MPFPIQEIARYEPTLYMRSDDSSPAEEAHAIDAFSAFHK